MILDSRYIDWYVVFLSFLVRPLLSWRPETGAEDVVGEDVAGVKGPDGNEKVSSLDVTCLKACQK